MNTAQLIDIGLLALIAVLLIVFAVRLKPNSSVVSAEIESAIARLGQETQHYVEVNAVLALTSQLRQHPELLDRLLQYSREVVSAALLARVNALGNDIRVVQKGLSEAEKNAVSLPSYQRDVQRHTTRLAELQAQLAAAHQAVEQFSAAHAV